MINQELSDYLHGIVKTMKLDSEEEKIILEYVNSIVENSKNIYEITKKDSNKSKIIKFLESLQETSNV